MMTGPLDDEIKAEQAALLCKACGLCCTGHLFIWVKLRPAELDPAEALGLTVFRSDPRQRGFSLPCPLWDGQCTIHSSAHYPRTCRAYKCKLLKEVLGEKIPLPEALTVIEQTKGLIHELEARLPAAPPSTFRERLVAQIESRRDDGDLQLKAEALLRVYANDFGVNDLVEQG